MTSIRVASPGVPSDKNQFSQKGMVITHESETVRKEDLRKVQDHQEKRQDHGHLREP